MKVWDYVLNALIVAMALFFIIATYGALFGKVTGYQFNEFGYVCVVVHDKGRSVMWCEPESEAVKSNLMKELSP